MRRTRQLLLGAFMALLQERRNIHSISVQEIATLATVNRATFYAHFEDKYALLESWMREKFHQALLRQQSTLSTLRSDTLRSLILAVFDFLAQFRGQIKPADKQFEPLFEIALQQELYEILLSWLKERSSETHVAEKALEATAQVISWAIFGPAAQWSRGDRAIPAEEMTAHVLDVVIAGLSPVIAAS